MLSDARLNLRTVIFNVGVDAVNTLDDEFHLGPDLVRWTANNVLLFVVSDSRAQRAVVNYAVDFARGRFTTAQMALFELQPVASRQRIGIKFEAQGQAPQPGIAEHFTAARKHERLQVGSLGIARQLTDQARHEVTQAPSRLLEAIGFAHRI